MRLHWTIGMAGVLDAVGGAPMLVRDGALVGQCNSACGSHPRTGIGVTRRGRILLVVVDGRQPRWSLGPTMDEFARIMRDLGAVNALNLDGGGSSTMVIRGKVVNRPSDGRERSISNAVLVLPGPDPGER
jgi:exopolysaccharide biosynthesis protein